ncbi:TonB-dependent receptor [Rapidithrix thailandica]|uniref:TonB-dependent receptor n=1 Tax=Rapidithrix thailandica TaxID=413964 RepID=A0AAW9SCE0_9BACT
MNVKSTTFYTLLLLLQSVWAYSQTEKGSLQGKVLNSLGEPAVYVSVLLKGTQNGTATNAQGEFTLNAKEGSYSLIFTSIEYQAREIPVQVKAGQTLTLPAITLQGSSQKLSEVTVSDHKQPSYKVDIPSSSLRLKTPLLETPQNIQVVTGKLLADQQIFDMSEGVARNVSGVTSLEHWGNYVRLNMRGSRVAPFRNGMNVEMQWGPLSEDMSMVERVEFVKGPAGFMLAHGEPSGFYNVVTKKPTGQTKGEVTFTLGSFDTYRSTLDLDGKMSKDGKLLYRINLMGQLKGSHRDFEFNNRYSVAPVLTYQFSDQTSLTAEYTYQYSRMSAIGSAYVFSPNGYGDLPDNATTAEPGMDPTDIKDHSLFLTLNHQLNSDWKLTAQLAYFRYDQTGSSLWPVANTMQKDGSVMRGISIWDALGESKLGQVFVNGEFQTGPITHRVLAGLDMGNKHYMADWNQGFSFDTPENPYNVYDPVHGTGIIPVFDRSKSLRQRAGMGNVVDQSYSAVYLQDELRFFEDKVRLTLAGRYTTVKDTKYTQVAEADKFSPRLGLNVSVTKGMSVYALYDQAFVPQSGTTKEGKGLDPIEGNNMEVGLKKEWFGGKWNTTVSVYQITKQNMKLPDPDNVNFSIQVGENQAKGLEFDVKGEILPGLNLTVNYAYTNSEITEDENDENIGNLTPGFAKHNTNAWLAYELRNSSLKGLGFSLGYQYLLERSTWSWAGASGKDALPDYFRMDGSVSWRNEKFRVALNINNLLDEYLYSGSAYADYYYWQTEPGRNFRLSVGYQF